MNSLVILLLALSFIGAGAFPTPVDIEASASNAEYRRIEGDIVPDDEDLAPGQIRRGAPDTSNPDRKWPLNQVISYKIVGSFSAENNQKIRDGFKFWTDNTCLTYQENGPTTPLIRVVNGNGCSSQIGRQGSQSQDLTLGSGCYTVGTIQHEIAHSIGLGHTHMRWDRDSYVTINMNNLINGTQNNFEKWIAANNNNFGIDYDYSSVLQYEPNGFAKDTSIPVITAKMPEYQSAMGQREKAAFSDIKMINLFYNCAQKCSSSSTKCQNGGIINSKTCNTCICPAMFVGSDCSQRNPGKGLYAKDCGGDLTATSSWQNVQGSMGVANTIYADNRSECYWNIKAPAGRKIEIRVNKSEMSCQYCSYNEMEIFARGFGIGGFKTCCPEKLAGKVYPSVDNGVSIRLMSAYLRPGINVDYRLV